MKKTAPPAPVSLETIGGEPKTTIPVELSTRFLEHFSEQLYTSPQKAFEELISNGWDAGATCVDVRIPDDLTSETATLTVLDNGESMDADGLKNLWHIAFSPKQNVPILHGRPVIGKFGIGKLATYVLAKKLTYICKAADGKIRRVTMNFAVIDDGEGASKHKLINHLKLPLYEVTEEEVYKALEPLSDGEVLAKLIRDGQTPVSQESENEFGAQNNPLSRSTTKTWTLAILSDLKPVGKQLKLGVLRRMLEAALPLGSEMAIRVNGDLLTSTKLDTPVAKEWILGPDLGIESVSIPNTAWKLGDPEEQKESIIKIEYGNLPVPHVKLPGLPVITGRATLYSDKISGGKSEERGASNGFRVNVLGRVVNQSDPSFGEENLSHAAWARFRMLVRADSLNTKLTTDREKFKDAEELLVFRAFLRRVFNKARTHYDDDANAHLPDGGDVLVRSLGVLSLNPLRNVVSDTLQSKPAISDLFDETGVKDRIAQRESWRNSTADDIRSALDQVKYEKLDSTESFAKFRIVDNTIVINKQHPFVAEHSRTKAEKELLRTMAMVNLLVDVFALDAGVEPQLLENMRSYRDKLMRIKAIERRESGAHIAQLLLATQHVSSNYKLLESAVSTALRYLGFEVDDMAKPGQPEGVARAYPIPTNKTRATIDDRHPPLYSFTFDAKSSKHDAALTGNIKLDGIVEHREFHKADFALVIAPGFEEGALATRCKQQGVTPISAFDLGRLLEYTVKHGAIPLTKLKDLFALHDPDMVKEWVDELDAWLIQQRPLTIDLFIKALRNLKGKIPDALPAGSVALECREHLQAVSVTDQHVIALAKGLSILIPDLIGVDNDKIVVNASADRVADAISTQLERLHVSDGG